MIPVAKPLLGPREEEAVVAVLRSGMLAQGPVVARLEDAFAQACGARHAVAVSSGTAALHAALLAHGIGSGDEVITSPFSFIATANAVLMTGARPVFVDIDADCFNLDATQLEAAITPRTKAIMPVHLYGHPADMRAIAAIAQRHGLVLIEDAAQAIGARSHGQLVGSRGTACFSLYATKNIMCGEGGIVVTDDPEVAERLRLLRAHGSRVRYQHEQLGYNYRLTDIQAAIACVQLERLPEFTQARSANAAYLSAQITHPAVTLPRVRPEVVHVFHQYTVRIHGDRDAAVRQLAAAGVGAAVFYPVPIHRQELYQKLGYHAALPVSERASREVVSLPVHPGLGAADLERIVAAVNALEVDQV